MTVSQAEVTQSAFPVTTSTAHIPIEACSAAALTAADPEAALMLRVKQGDADAFDQLCLRVHSRLFHRLYGWVAHRETAEDLAQETLLRIFANRERYEPSAKFSTYLFAIAGNLAANELRRRGRHDHWLIDNCTDTGDLLQAQPDPKAAEPVEQLERRERDSVLREAVDSLGSRQRSALVLRHYDGLSYDGIAAALATTPIGAKALLARARRMLAQRLRTVASLF